MNLVRIAKTGVLIAAGALLWVTLRSDRVSELRPLVAAAHRHAMPDIKLNDLNGRTWRLQDHGGQVILVNFWASWCPPCREETPGLVHLAQSYRDKGVAVVGISMDEGGPAAVGKFVRDFHVTYPILMPSQRFPFANEVDSLPTSVLIDQQGKVAKTYIGAVSEATFGHDIDKLLNPGKGA
jgi:cytochrome c biogenesis protein CcmG, thiol:disulfide interchange protein DsbE